MSKVYDAIIVIETDFQKTIVDKLVKQKFNGGNILIIDARNNKIEISGVDYHVNLGGVRWMMRSLKEIKKLPKLETQELIGTHFTGVNCRSFETFIKYRELSLIDDGIGTPAMLRHGRFIKTADWYARLFLANILVLFYYGRGLKTVKKFVDRIKTYYTIYDFVSNDYTEELKYKNIEHIDYYSGYQNIPIIKGKTCYIGSGINPQLEKCLKFVKSRHEEIIYFSHPRESISPIVKQYATNIIRPTTTIENYFKENGAPEFIYGSLSSAILNMKLSKLQNQMTVFTSLPHDDPYFMIFEENGIEIYNTNEIE